MVEYIVKAGVTSVTDRSTFDSPILFQRATCRGGEVRYRTDAREIAIDELRGELDLTSMPNWGMVLRRGLVELTAHDFAVIAQAMIDEPVVNQAYG